MLTGVQLPTGATEVDLTFSSRTYETGKALTLAAMGLALVVVAAGLVADRRRAPVGA